MTDWSLILIPLTLVAIVALFGMVGCGLSTDPGPGNGNGDGPEPNPDLVGEWKLGESSGATAAADSIDSRPGTYRTIVLQEAPQSPATANPPVLGFGASGLLAGAPSETCIIVDGGFVEIPFDQALNTPTFTAMAWCLPEFAFEETVDGQPVFRCVLASREGNGVQPAGFMIYSGPDLSNPTDATLYWQVWVGDGKPGKMWTMLVGPPVSLNETVHLAVTYDGTTLMLYVDHSGEGPPDAQMATGYSPNTSKSFYIGMGAPDAPQPAYPFKGRLQDVRYYKAAQTSDVIDGIVTSGNPMAP
jgi:hypothetical protein